MMTDDDINRIYDQLSTISREIGETKTSIESIKSAMADIKNHDIRLNALEKWVAQLKVAGFVIITIITALCALVVAGAAFFTYFK